MQENFKVIELLVDVHTEKGILKKGEVHKLTGMGLIWHAIKIGTDHYHIIHEGMYKDVK